MKHFFITLTLLFAALFIHADNIIRLNASTAEPDPTRDIEYLDNGVTVTYRFSSVSVKDDPLFANAKMVSFYGFGFNDTDRQPMIAVRNDKFAIPPGKTASVELVDSEYHDFQIELSPARAPLIDSSDYGYTADNVSPIDEYDGFFPDNIIASGNIEKYRGIPLLNVSVSPIQYDMKNKTTRIYSTVKYKITFTSESSDVYKAPRNYDTPANSFLSNTILNIKSIQSTEPEPDIVGACEKNVSDYLIITTNEFSDAAQRLAEWKKHMGFNSHIVIDDTWSVEKVKSTVQDKYDTLENLEFLLLMGDFEDIPAPIDTSPTDLYYGCMEGPEDTYPDIYRGRLPVSSAEEADIVVNKIIQYENNPPKNADYYNTGINCAEFQDDNNDGYADRRFAQTSEEIHNYMMLQEKNVTRIYYTDRQTTPLYWNNGRYGNGDPVPEELRKPNFAWDGSAEDIINAINKGGFYVLHRDHGGLTEWGRPSFTNNDIIRLENKNLLPVVFSMNCKTGSFNTGTCFAEKFLRKSDGGCVAIFAATETSYSGYNDALACGMFDAIWPEPGLRPRYRSTIPTGDSSITPEPTYLLGQILDQGQMRMAETYGTENYYTSILTRELFHCFGDPSMRIHTDMPTNFEDVTITRNSTGVSVHVSEKATVTFYDTRTKNITSFIGRDAYCPTQYPDSIKVCISAHNKIPYIEGALTPGHTIPDSNYIYNPEHYDNKIHVSYNRVVDFSNAKVTLTNKRNKSVTVLPVSTLDPLAAYIDVPDSLLKSLGYQNRDVFSFSVSGVVNNNPYYNSAELISGELEYRASDDMPVWSVTPDPAGHISNLSQNVKFTFNEELACEEVEIISGNKFDKRHNYKKYQVMPSDSIGVELEKEFVVLTTATPTIKVILSKIADSKGFYIPYSYIQADYRVRYDSGASLINIYPDPETADCQNVLDEGHIKLTFSDRVAFPDSLGNVATMTYSGSAGDGSRVDFVQNDLNIEQEENGNFVISVPVTGVTENSIDVKSIALQLKGLTAGITPFEEQPSVVYNKTVQGNIVRAKKHSGIESSLDANNGKYVIYDISGRRIYTSNPIDRLEKGIYIINGEKIIIK